MKTNTLSNSFICIFSCLALLSCGPGVPRKDLQNLPSLIEIIAINFDQNELKIRVSHRHKTTREGNQLSCQLAIKDYSPITFNEIPVPNLTTYAVETLDISLASDNQDFATEKNHELPYVLDCFLFSDNFRKEHLINKATLYRVPGTINTYR